MVALARALIVGTKLLLLDEPTEGIAPVLARRFIEILRDLKAEGESVLVAESNDKHLHGLLDRSYVIERGSVKLVARARGRIARRRGQRSTDAPASAALRSARSARGAPRGARGRCTPAHTGGLAPGIVQANVCILQGDWAREFQTFCERNPKPCPLLAASEPGRSAPAGARRRPRHPQRRAALPRLPRR